MYNYCKILHGTYGYDITVVSYLEDGDDPNAKPDFISDVMVLQKVSANKKSFIKNIYPKKMANASFSVLGSIKCSSYKRGFE